MFDLICYILFDLTVEGSVDTKLPKGLRYTLLTILSIVFFGAVIGLVWYGIARLKTSTGGGIILIALGVGILIYGLIWYFSTMKKMKNIKPDEEKGE